MIRMYYNWSGSSEIKMVESFAENFQSTKYTAIADIGYHLYNIVLTYTTMTPV